MLGDATRKAEEEFSSRNAIVPPSVINMEFPNLDNWESVPDNYCVLPYILEIRVRNNPSPVCRTYK